MLGDKAYDSAELREELDERGTRPVIPNRSNRKQPYRFSKCLYKLRWRIESAFNRLKDFRRIATRYGMVDLMSLGPRSFQYSFAHMPSGSSALRSGNEEPTAFQFPARLWPPPYSLCQPPTADMRRRYSASIPLLARVAP